VDYKETVFDQVMATNAKGVWNCMRFEIPAMIRAGGGSIVNISSVATEPATALISAYVASKYAVVGLSKTAALEYAALNVRINIISPGLIDTPMVRKLMAAHPDEMEAMRLDNPIPRLGTGAEIGEAAAWLCSDRSAYCTGTNLFIDGGRALK
jgi:NAD(P)-dependent dehydrogenase (short-subunit alcohol dehydrogenase family)